VQGSFRTKSMTTWSTEFWGTLLDRPSASDAANRAANTAYTMYWYEVVSIVAALARGPATFAFARNGWARPLYDGAALLNFYNRGTSAMVPKQAKAKPKPKAKAKAKAKAKPKPKPTTSVAPTGGPEADGPGPEPEPGPGSGTVLDTELDSASVDAVYRAMRPILARGIEMASRRRAPGPGDASAPRGPRGPRGPPALRLAEFISAQWSAEVRGTLRRLTRGRTWSFVDLPRFMARLRPQAHTLAREAARRAAPTCVVVDSVHKSSFWVFLLMLHVLHADGGDGLADYRAATRDNRLRVVVDRSVARGEDAISAGLHAPLGRLPAETQLVLVDDAAYTGVQLADFYQRVRLHWRLAHGDAAAARRPLLICVPYISRNAAALLAGARLLPHTPFNALFHRRSHVTVLAMDLFLSPRPRGGGAAGVQSYLFDFLRLYPDQTMLMFEHKIADDVSIPYRWLHLGPCLPPPGAGGPAEAYRVRPSRAAPLVAFLRQEVAHGRWMAPPAPGGLPGDMPVPRMASEAEAEADGAQPSHMADYRIFAHRVADLVMSSPTFRADFMDRVPLTPARPPPPAATAGRKYLPLLPSSYCDERYRGFVERHLLASGAYSDSRRVLYYMPECYTPPYKTPAFRRALAAALGAR
jgi:hypothetical protein